jgi:mycofactocin system transcriptional regulator
MRVVSQPGRPRSTTPDRIQRAAFALFGTRRFDDVTVEDIARAAGIGRRTFFRYYPSKNDVVWGDWAGSLAALDAELAAADRDAPLAHVLRDAVIAYNHVPRPAVAQHRLRMELILHVPALQAHSALRYGEWRQVVARHVAARLRLQPTSLRPQVSAAAALGAATSAYEQWLRQPTAGSARLATLLGQAMDALADWP